MIIPPQEIYPKRTCNICASMLLYKELTGCCWRRPHYEFSVPEMRHALSPGCKNETLSLKIEKETMEFHFPPAALASFKAGNHVMVHLGVAKKEATQTKAMEHK